MRYSRIVSVVLAALLATASAFAQNTGLFKGPFVFPVGSTPLTIAAADFNGDGRLDLLPTVALTT
ncbi:MAG: VCBS repeat-containing protein [Acidobacteriales bacterium]|nr:VCBS repeat-containing protein [Terriglobales bacterium]